MGPASGLRLLRNLLSIFFRVMADVPCQQGCPYNRWHSVFFVYCHPITFRLSPFRWHCWCRASHYPLPVSLHKSVSQPITHLVCSCIMSFDSLVAHFYIGSMVGGHHACSPAHWLNPSGSFSCISFRHCAVSACELLLFLFYFNLGVILIYSPRSYEAGAFLSFGTAWTASGLGQWFFHESSFFFTDMSLLSAINKTSIHE